MRNLWRRFPLGVVPLLLLLALWQTTARLGVYSHALFPSPAEVAHVFTSQWRLVLYHTESSLLRVVIGVAAAFFTAVPAGLIIGRYPVVSRLMDWTIQIFRCFPSISLIPLAIMFFGIGDRPAIMLIWLAAFWPLLISTIFGVRNVEHTLLAVARVARASDRLVVLDILLPNALPSILNGLRLSVGAGWLTVVTAEMMAVKSGLGYLILYAQMIFRPDEVVAGILVIGLIGLILDRGISLLRKHLCQWQDGLVMQT